PRRRPAPARGRGDVRGRGPHPVAADPSPRGPRLCPRHGPCREVDPRQTARRGADLGRRPPPGDAPRYPRGGAAGPGGRVLPPRPLPPLRALVPRRGGRLPVPPRHHHTEVLRACSMIPPSASGIESPLTTV